MGTGRREQPNLGGRKADRFDDPLDGGTEPKLIGTAAEAPDRASIQLHLELVAHRRVRSQQPLAEPTRPCQTPFAQRNELVGVEGQPGERCPVWITSGAPLSATS